MRLTMPPAHFVLNEIQFDTRVERMRAMHLAAAAPLLVLVALSAIGSVALGDVQQIPIQWTSSWTPKLYAPKWVALTLLPVFCLATTATLLVRDRDKPQRRQIRTLLVTGAIMIACQVFYLSLLAASR